MKNFLAGIATVLICTLAGCFGSWAQTTSATVVTACGTPPVTYSAGANRALTQDTTGKLCDSGGGGGGGGGAITAPLGPQAPATSVATVGSNATPISSAALAANQVIITGAHQLLSFQVSADSTLSGAAWWIMVYNATTAPADGAITPAKCYALPSGATAFTGAFFAPVTFAIGIVIGVSTTGCFTKTASTHAFISGDYQ